MQVQLLDQARLTEQLNRQIQEVALLIKEVLQLLTEAVILTKEVQIRLHRQEAAL